MKSKAQNQSKFMRFITLPLKVLSKARDFYVRSLTDCSDRVSYGGNSMGLPTGQASAFPKSLSVSSSRSNGVEDYRELIRAASVRSLGHRNEVDMFLQQQMRQQSSMVGSRGLPKSCSVGMGRIDEDRPSDFGQDGANGGVKAADLLYPRSRSCAVTKRSVVL
ncbi:hypothetical protein CFOL_v3_00150 [Cephalotus follicularis]|uniref:Uncharacterized protein n=1 Tax=Cephalotus follicularis TaxID=3775 RepID=A0A1Q3ALM3_CEPFO|nr:hypothetical protein CFOL_v3_00150 [Cephalotus follicularis]